MSIKSTIAPETQIICTVTFSDLYINQRENHKHTNKDREKHKIITLFFRGRLSQLKPFSSLKLNKTIIGSDQMFNEMLITLGDIYIFIYIYILQQDNKFAWGIEKEEK